MNKGYKGRTECYAQGGPVVTKSNSQFFKTPDSFRTDKQRSDYAGGKPKGKDKTLPPVKPQK